MEATVALVVLVALVQVMAATVGKVCTPYVIPVSMHPLKVGAQPHKVPVLEGTVVLGVLAVPVVE
jgi:hypothetical protein